MAGVFLGLSTTGTGPLLALPIHAAGRHEVPRLEKTSRPEEVN